MRVIAEHDQRQLGFHDPNDGLITFERQASRAVLCNAKGEIAVMNFSQDGSYKLPGGGIDDGETPEDALYREILEETGYTISRFNELGIVKESRYYCGMSQVSYAFIAEVDEFIGTNLTDEEAARGMNVQWFNSVESAIDAIENGAESDGNGGEIGSKMMKLRDIKILQAAQSQVAKDT